MNTSKIIALAIRIKALPKCAHYPPESSVLYFFLGALEAISENAKGRDFNRVISALESAVKNAEESK